jgi:hypothetical protein
MQQQISKYYYSARQRQTQPGGISVLSIAEQKIAMANGGAQDPATTLILALGAQSVAVSYLRHQPPSASELEQAIMVIEDAIAPARPRMLEGSVWFSADPALRSLAQNLGLSTQGAWQLGIDQVENSFQRLAAQAMGAPAPLGAEQLKPLLAAYLLILRELMHHMPIRAIHGLPPESA